LLTKVRGEREIKKRGEDLGSPLLSFRIGGRVTGTENSHKNSLSQRIDSRVIPYYNRDVYFVKGLGERQNISAVFCIERGKKCAMKDHAGDSGGKKVMAPLRLKEREEGVKGGGGGECQKEVF